MKSLAILLILALSYSFAYADTTQSTLPSPKHPSIEQTVAKQTVSAQTITKQTIAQQYHITKIWGFGDSLTDTGNKGVVNENYDSRRATNRCETTKQGKVWIEFFAESLGLPAPTPSGHREYRHHEKELCGGTNYAIIGGKLVGNGASDVPPQVSAYLAKHKPRPTDLFCINGGANDTINRQALKSMTKLQTQGFLNTGQEERVANSLVLQAARLINAGARRVMVQSVPDLGITPVATMSGMNPVITAWAVRVNEALKLGIEKLEASSGVDIIYIDSFSIMRGLCNRHDEYGIKAVSTSYCIGDPDKKFWLRTYVGDGSTPFSGDACHRVFLLAVMLLTLPILSFSISPSHAQERRSLKEMLKSKSADTFGHKVYGWKTPEVDEQKAAKLGIRKLQGEHLTLYTDLPSSPAIDTLPAIFDQAFPQWCEFLGISSKKAKKAHLTGALMKDPAPFKAAGILPSNVPKFKHGFAINDRFWMFDQESDYYRRHLILHEGVHGLMNTVLGSCGPPWYMESTAEYLGTHRIDEDGKVTVGIIPKNRQEVPMWGRVPLIREAIRAGRGRTLDEVLRFAPDDYFNDEAYAWSWAAAVLLDRSPETRKIYRSLAKHTLDPQFNRRARGRLRSRWNDLARQWLIMIDSIEYGYDIERTAVDMKPGRLLGSDGAAGKVAVPKVAVPKVTVPKVTVSKVAVPKVATVQVAADRGWQNSGIYLEAGKTYRLTAEGRYRVVKGKDGLPDWMSEPGGVAIRYYNWRPLGLLQATILPPKAGNSAEKGSGTFHTKHPSGRSGKRSQTPFLRPINVGLGTTFTPEVSGTLLLRINDSPAELEENEGEATVRIEAV